VTSYLSLFAGVGGFDIGAHMAGWDPVAMVEWNEDAQSVLRHRFPEVPLYGDVTEYDGATHPADVIVGGFPCQDVSIAGQRAGVLADGTRSNLYQEIIRITKEMQDATDRLQPRWVVLENVLGLLSVDSGDGFAAVVDDLAALGAVVVEWALLDSQFFGVPQRRQRVFVVACFDPATAAGCPDPLLPVAARVPRDHRASLPQREVVAALTATGVGTCGADDNQAQAGHLLAVPVGRDLNAAVTSKWSKGTGGPSGDECQNLVPVQIGYPDPAGTLGAGEHGHRMDLDSSGAYIEVRSVAENQRGEVREADIIPNLTAGGGKAGQGYPAVAFAMQPDDGGTEETKGALRLVETDVAPTIAATDGAKTTDRGLRIGYQHAVRRITPLEAERLQGWPDDWTRWRADGTEQSDSARYRQIGNGITSFVAEWVCGRLNIAESATRPPAGDHSSTESQDRKDPA
jgi:DNA (cytosine-5)-methyltransferase 1